jgi:uncharacterized RDD family membrane protein YckC
MEQTNQTNSTPETVETVQSTPETTASVLKLATPGQRIIAYILDAIILSIPLLCVILPIAFSLGIFASAVDSSTSRSVTGNPLIGAGTNIFVSFLIGFVALAISFVYYVIIPTKVLQGQTPGKKLMNLKMVRENGGDVDLMDLVKRYGINFALSLISNIPFLNLIACCAGPIIGITNVVMLFSDEKNQTLFDKVAGTLVVQTNA